jgi:hypothetical protein
MRDDENLRKQTFDALFAAYGPDIVSYCGWRAGATPALVAPAHARNLLEERLRAVRSR